MPDSPVNHKPMFGSMAVFMTTISTILGAILFLRFGFAMGNTGFAETSVDADLTIVGFRHESIKRKGVDLFTGYGDIGNILFVSSQKEKEIT